MKDSNRYVRIIEAIFHSRFKARAEEVAFKRDDIVQAAKNLALNCLRILEMSCTVFVSERPCLNR